MVIATMSGPLGAATSPSLDSGRSSHISISTEFGCASEGLERALPWHPSTAALTCHCYSYSACDTAADSARTNDAGSIGFETCA